MKKRGISPLIASILLIGFAIAVAVIVFTWGKGYVTETAEKEGSLSQAQLECNQVEIEITEEGKVMNTGGVEIKGFLVRDKDGSPIAGIDLSTTILGVSEISEFKLSPGEQVIPCVRPEGAGAPLVPCSDKAIKLRE